MVHSNPFLTVQLDEQQKDLVEYFKGKYSALYEDIISRNPGWEYSGCLLTAIDVLRLSCASLVDAITSDKSYLPVTNESSDEDDYTFKLEVPATNTEPAVGVEINVPVVDLGLESQPLS